MKIEDLRTISREDLIKRLEKKTQELFQLEFDIRTAQEKDYAKRSKLKKEVARIKSLINDSTYVVVEKKESKKENKKVESIETVKEDK